VQAQTDPIPRGWEKKRNAGERDMAMAGMADRDIAE
jgi:hypothetical protein